MSIVTATTPIKHFVKEQLGCGCPDEVFLSIRVSRQPDCFDGLPVESLLQIGGRLLVAVGEQGDWRRLSSSLEKIIDSGISFRDSNGFNRFRLVIATDDEEARLTIQRAYDALTGKDERTHIHFVTPNELPDEVAEHAE